MELFTGQVLCHARITITPPLRPLPVSTFRPPPKNVADVIQQMGCGKAVGLDEVPAEILKAGGDVLAIQFDSLIDRIVQSQQWPWRWQGGRIATLRKKKEDYRAC